MPETEYKRVFQLARDRALFGFSGLSQRMLKDADESLMQALSEARSMLDQKALKSARTMLQQDGNLLLKRLDAQFQAQLERAVRTMYTDLRPDITKLSADDLSLIDDEVVSRQIEVDRLLRRMRDANEEIIGRLNVIVAQLHGDRSARERENPFRPYLIARTLYEVLKESSTEEATAELLFEHLSNALIKHLPGYYTGIVSAFESGGIQAQYTLQRSRLVAGQRYFGALPLGPEAAPEHLSARALAGMQSMMARLVDAPQTASLSDSSQTASSEQPPSLQDFLVKVLGAGQGQGTGAGGTGPGRPFGTSPGTAGEAAADAHPLIARLNQVQSRVAAASKADAPVAVPQPFGLAEQLDTQQASPLERIVIDVVAMLFDFLLGDEKIPDSLRRQLGRLQAPFLKAALLDAQLLQDGRHPARQLLNRLCGVAAGCDATNSFGAAVLEQTRQTVQYVLERFEHDTRAFRDALDEFERGMASHLRRAEDGTLRAAEALDRTEQAGMLLAATKSALTDLLAPLKTDARLVAFITNTWSRVLVRAWMDDGKPGKAGVVGFQQFRELLPELVWSVQEKQSPQERSALMRLLPELVKRLRAGLALIRLPENEARQALDHLVELHTQVLRPGTAKRPQDLSSLEDLRGRFSLLSMDGAAAPWMHGAKLNVAEAAVASALEEAGTKASLHLEGDPMLMEEGEQFLAELLPGSCMKLPGTDVGGATLVRLHAITPQRSLYLFKHEKTGALSVYAPAALLAALMEGSLRPVEYAPLFERAVESMLAGAEAVQAGAAQDA